MPSGRSEAAKQQSHTMLTPDIIKSGISWEEMGVLSQMLNIPECDYVTPEQLARYSTDPPSTVRKLLDALVKKVFVRNMDGIHRTFLLFVDTLYEFLQKSGHRIENTLAIYSPM